MAERISEYMKEQNEQLHEENSEWGANGDKWHKAVYKIYKTYNCRSILDYGAGKGFLLDKIRRKYKDVEEMHNYEPAVPKFNISPSPADLVIVTHVLEHVEPYNLNYVISDICDLTDKIAFIVCDSGESGKKLPDGRDSNLNQMKPKEWIDYIHSIFGKDCKYRNFHRRSLQSGFFRPANENNHKLTLLVSK